MKISIIGDVYLGNPIENYIKEYGIEYTKSRLWASVNDSDLILMNLEAPITVQKEPKKKSKVVNLKSNPIILDLFDNRFIFNLANNHIMDYGDNGLNETIEYLSSRDLIYAGAGSNLQMASQVIKKKYQGIKFGFCFIADPRFNPATDIKAGTFPADSDLLLEKVRCLREESDFTIVALHMGIEFISAPSPRMIELVEFFSDLNVNIIQFHHSHTISGITKKKRSLVFWGTGNFAFANHIAKGNRLLHETAVFQVKLNSQINEITNYSYTPLLINETGIPVLPKKSTKKRIERIIKRWSKRIDYGKNLHFWRMISFMNPAYLIKFSLPNYLIMAKNEGIIIVFKTILSTIKLHFLKNK